MSPAWSTVRALTRAFSNMSAPFSIRRSRSPSARRAGCTVAAGRMATPLRNTGEAQRRCTSSAEMTCAASVAPMRAQVSATFLFVNNLVGIGGGPVAVALLTDRVFGVPQSVGTSLAIVGGVAALVAAAVLAAGIRAFDDGVRSVQAADAAARVER